MRITAFIAAVSLAVSSSVAPVFAQSQNAQPAVASTAVPDVDTDGIEQRQNGIAQAPLSSDEGGDVLHATLAIGGAIVIAGIIVALLNDDDNNRNTTTTNGN